MCKKNILALLYIRYTQMHFHNKRWYMLLFVQPLVVSKNFITYYWVMSCIYILILFTTIKTHHTQRKKKKNKHKMNNRKKISWPLLIFYYIFQLSSFLIIIFLLHCSICFTKTHEMSLSTCHMFILSQKS